jgi:hypothetical protein
LRPNAIIQISKFISVVTSCGGHPTTDIFAKNYELHYQHKKIHLDGCETTLAMQFGCIAFHPTRYVGWVRLTLSVRNKWTSDWASNWFYCKVPSEQIADVWGKWNYTLRSMMTQRNYSMDALFECGPGDVDVTIFVEVALLIGGRDAVEEFLA